MKRRKRKPKLTRAERQQLARDWAQMAKESEETLRQKEAERGYWWAEVPVDPRVDARKTEPPF